MNYVLLLGAGFSRNWGGWLASEMFEYLLGCPEIDDRARKVLWKYRKNGGFEAALVELQVEISSEGGVSEAQSVNGFQDAIRQAFADMNEAFCHVQFEFNNHVEFSLRRFLAKFDAIFSLNQDFLMERHYLSYLRRDVSVMNSQPKFNGAGIPGMKPENENGWEDQRVSWRPHCELEFDVKAASQPFFKLHGSSNWLDDKNGQQLLIMGGNKAAAIKQHPILSRYHDKFREYLGRGHTLLMVIGYSFGDDHINSIIVDAASHGSLRIFVIDPAGLDLLDKNLDVDFPAPNLLVSQLQPYVIGASRRTLREIFGSDRIEFSKVMRFFERATDA